MSLCLKPALDEIQAMITIARDMNEVVVDPKMDPEDRLRALVLRDHALEAVELYVDWIKQQQLETAPWAS